MNFCSLDIETSLDFDLVRQTEPELAEMSDEEIAQYYDDNGVFPKPNVCFVESVAMVGFSGSPDDAWIESTGQHDEKSCIELVDSVLSEMHCVITMNGSAFDMPVLAIRAPRAKAKYHSYWQREGARKYDTLFGRYHWAHTDLMDILAHYGACKKISLTDLCLTWNLPGKIGIGGDSVQKAVFEEDWESIINYNEVDAMLTMMLYLKWVKYTGPSSGVRPKQADEYVESLYEMAHSLQDSNPLFEDLVNKWDGSI